MQLHVLGSAAGGGVPQWNCGCSNCTAARDKRLPPRTQASLAASADGDAWVLFNATTDIRAQIEATPDLTPRGVRESPIRAVFLTDANIDHAAGLLDFRQAGPLAVYSTAVVRETLLANPMFAPFALLPRRWEAIDDGTVEACGLRVRALAMPGLLPSYAGASRVAGAATAYVIEDASGASALYAPIFLEVTPELARACDAADAVFFDGSFWSDDEMRALGMGTRSARDMGHAPIDGPGGSLETLRRARSTRKFYTHLNNSNPLLDPASAPSVALRAAGIETAQDATRLALRKTTRAVGTGG